MNKPKNLMLADEAWLRRRYQDELATQAEIAREARCTPGAVCVALQRHQIASRTAEKTRELRGTKQPKRFPLLADARWLSQKYLEEWHSQPEIASIVGCNVRAVNRALRQAKVPPRQPGVIRPNHIRAGSMMQLQDPAWITEQRITLGRSLADIAAELHCTTGAIRAMSAKFGIRTREPLPRGEALQDADRRTYTRPAGYTFVWVPDHPTAQGDGWVAEHRLVAEAALGRFLTTKEVVHHLNRNPNDNREENLLVFSSNGKHMSFHSHQPDWIPRCSCCGKPNPERLEKRPDDIPLYYG